MFWENEPWVRFFVWYLYSCILYFLNILCCRLTVMYNVCFFLLYFLSNIHKLNLGNVILKKEAYEWKIRNYGSSLIYFFFL